MYRNIERSKIFPLPYMPRQMYRECCRPALVMRLVAWKIGRCTFTSVTVPTALSLSLQHIHQELDVWLSILLFAHVSMIYREWRSAPRPGEYSTRCSHPPIYLCLFTVSSSFF